MYIVIVGCGKLGYHLTRALLSAGHEVLVIEEDSRKIAGIVDEFGSVAISGDGSEPAVLDEAGAGRADVLIAVTGRDEDNLVACQVAKLRFNVRKTVALVTNPQNESLFRKLGVDVAVSQTNVIMTHVEEELPAHPLVHLIPIRGADRRLVDIRIPSDAEVVGKPVEQVALPEGVLISLLVNEAGDARLPIAGEVFQPNDQVLAVTTGASEEKLLQLLTRVAG